MQHTRVSFCLILCLDLFPEEIYYFWILKLYLQYYKLTSYFVHTYTGNWFRYQIFGFFPCRCQDVTFPAINLDTSIIVCFFNEQPSALLRLVHSINDQTPQELVKEIILVDDSSTLGRNGRWIFLLSHSILLSSYKVNVVIFAG